MGVLSKFESSFANVRINISPRVEIEDEVNIPKVVLPDERLFIPSKEDKSIMNQLMVAHNIEDYRRSKIEVVLLPKVDIEITKILEIDKDELRMKVIMRR